MSARAALIFFAPCCRRQATDVASRRRVDGRVRSNIATVTRARARVNVNTSIFLSFCSRLTFVCAPACALTLLIIRVCRRISHSENASLVYFRLLTFSCWSTLFYHKIRATCDFQRVFFTPSIASIANCPNCKDFLMRSAQTLLPSLA